MILKLNSKSFFRGSLGRAVPSTAMQLALAAFAEDLSSWGARVLISTRASDRQKYLRPGPGDVFRAACCSLPRRLAPLLCAVSLLLVNVTAGIVARGSWLPMCACTCDSEDRSRFGAAASTQSTRAQRLPRLFFFLSFPL